VTPFFAFSMAGTGTLVLLLLPLQLLPLLFMLSIVAGTGIAGGAPGIAAVPKISCPSADTRGVAIGVARGIGLGGAGGGGGDDEDSLLGTA